MPENALDQLFKDGVLQSSTPRIISDAEIKRRDVPVRLRTTYQALQSWADDARTAAAAEQLASDGWAAATPAQRDAANRALHTRMAVTFERLAVFFERFGDVLMERGLDQ